MFNTNPNRMKHKLSVIMMALAMFGKSTMAKARGKLHIGANKVNSKKIKREGSFRSEYYCRPQVKYNNGMITRVSRSLALNLIENGTAIIIKGN